MSENISSKIKSWRQLVIENALDAVIAINENGIIIDWNTQAELIFGWEKSQALGKNISIIIPPEYQASHSAGIKRFLETGIGPILNKRVELEAIKSTGERICVELTVSPVIEENQTLFYSFSRDITHKKKLENEQKKQQATLREILINAPTAIAIINIKGSNFIFELVNVKFQELITVSEPQLIGKSLLSFSDTNPNFIEWLSKSVKQNLNTHSLISRASVPIEFNAPNENKEIRYFDFVFQPLVINDSLEKIIIFCHEVTSVVYAQKTAERKEKKLNAIINASPAFISFISPDLTYRFVNKKYEEVFNIKISDIIGMPVKNLLAPEVYEKTLPYFEEALRGITSRVDASIFDHLGNELFLDVQYVPVFVNEEISGIVVIAHDITERKIDEEDQKTLNEISSFLAKTTDNEELIINTTTKLLATKLNAQRCWVSKVDVVNQLAQVEQDYSSLGDSLAGVYNLTSFGALITRDWVTEWMTSISDTHKDIRTKDYADSFNKIKVRSLLSFPLHRGGEITSMFNIARNIPWDWSRREKKIIRTVGELLWSTLENNRLLKELKTVIQSKDEFISICSHELKTPVTSMKLQYQIASRQLEKGDDSVFSREAVIKRVTMSMKQIDRMSKLIDDMLDVSNISYGRLKMNLSPLDAAELVKEVSERFQLQCEVEKIPLTIKLPKEKVLVSGDIYRLEQVISNLINNAIKYGGKTPILVEVNPFADHVEINVCDKGKGISKKNLTKIFDRYERGGQNKSVSGLGLGLYISSQIVEFHGGKIHVESEINHGTKFTVELPLLRT